jgi:hypothetical protein
MLSSLRLCAFALGVKIMMLAEVTTTEMGTWVFCLMGAAQLGTDTLAFIAANAASVFVCFRGTQDLRNWITDLDCRRVATQVQGSNKAEVHAGFRDALNSVLPGLRETLTRLAAGKANVFFTGHSLGGALAMLAAGWWETGIALPSARQWLYTFGQPRVGNAAWTAWYDRCLKDRSWRVVHAEDIVPRVPWLLHSYRHAGHEAFYDALGVLHLDLPWWGKAASDVLGTWAEWRAAGRVAQLADHHVLTYQRLFAAAPADPVRAET